MDEDANIRFGAGVVTMKRESGEGGGGTRRCVRTFAFVFDGI